MQLRLLPVEGLELVHNRLHILRTTSVHNKNRIFGLYDDGVLEANGRDEATLRLYERALAIVRNRITGRCNCRRSSLADTSCSAAHEPTSDQPASSGTIMAFFDFSMTA